MAWAQRTFPAFVVLCLLAACGGNLPGDGAPGTGDGGTTSPGDSGILKEDAGTGPADSGTGPGDAGTDSSESPAMTFAPSLLQGAYGSGDSIGLSVVATLRASVSGKVYIAVLDKAGVFDPHVWVQPSDSPGTYYASVQTSSTLPEGRYQGEIDVLLCRDEACGAQYPGSPSHLPYDLQVLRGTHLTLLTRWPSVPDWETYQANPAHTGYVPVTLEASRFSPRWSWKLPENEISLSPLVVANGLVYVSDSPTFSTTSTKRLFALRESDKELQWDFDFGLVQRLNPPAVSGGEVFIATANDANTFMWSFDAATGDLRSKTAFNSQPEQFQAPTIHAGVVYAACEGDELCAFDAATGAQSWSVGMAQWAMEWTPSVDETSAYTFLEGVLSVRDTSSGQEVFKLADPKYDWDGYSMGAPVLGTGGSVIAVSSGNLFHDNHLLNFDTSARRLSWSVTGRYGGNPVLAHGVVYAVNVPNGAQMKVEARSASTGALSWSWTPPEGEWARSDSGNAYGDLLVTDNLLFVSTDSHVYAIDLVKHTPVWSYWKGGSLAISANGVLYINSGGTVGAVNLK